MIDGRVNINVSVSNLERLKRIGSSRGLVSNNSVLNYVLSYYEQSNKELEK